MLELWAAMSPASVNCTVHVSCQPSLFSSKLMRRAKTRSLCSALLENTRKPSSGAVSRGCEMSQAARRCHLLIQWHVIPHQAAHQLYVCVSLTILYRSMQPLSAIPSVQSFYARSQIVDGRKLSPVCWALDGLVGLVDPHLGMLAASSPSSSGTALAYVQSTVFRISEDEPLCPRTGPPSSNHLASIPGCGSTRPTRPSRAQQTGESFPPSTICDLT